MRPEYDPAMSANLVMMLLGDVLGVVWLVDDEKEAPFYELAKNEDGRVVPAYGHAIDVLQTVVNRGGKGVVAAVRGSNELPRSLPVFRPELGDVASLLLSSPSADRVLSDVGGWTWLRACRREIGEVVPRAVALASLLPEVLVDESGVGLDEAIEELFDWENANIASGEPPERDLDSTGRPGSFLVNESQCVADARAHLLRCDGMKVVAVLAAFTRRFRPRGICSSRSVTTTELLAELRLAFNFEDIEIDSMYWDLKAWQWLNPRYPLFRRWRRLEPFEILLDARYIRPDFNRLLQMAGPSRPVTLIQLDLDNFKNVNETLGHIEGDEAIKLCESVFRRALGGRGDAYRRGGDELSGFMFGLAEDIAKAKVEQLRSDVESTFSEWSAQRRLVPAPTASIGAVHITERFLPDYVVERLEEAQQEAKRLGKNVVVLKNLCMDRPLG